ncbi:PepSY-associated TM helix domain-containing protein [Methylomonas sp. AM2-LC]|uniref:PepSY-associated TM helix domain-containing protein n=1 Tax=Methylomonas sp. AM2-LC TaxID=3153301 RepID=UPI0032675A48
MKRHFWVLIHRYAGLFMALVLTIAGLTGSILAFYHELGEWLNPPPANKVAILSTPMLDPFVLRKRALLLEPHASINNVNLKQEPGEIYIPEFEAKIDPATRQPYELQAIKLNPYTGEQIPVVLSASAENQSTGYWPLTRKNILPFIYALHYSLALGQTGSWLFGIAAVIWTADCFVGFYLTLPARKKNSLPTAALKAGQTGCNFRQRWSIAWKIKWPSSNFRLNFDLHRAGGLWTWLMLLIFAWSSVLLNLGEQVYIPVMKQFFELTLAKDYPIADLPQPHPDPRIDFKTAYRKAQGLMAEQSQQKGFMVMEERSISYVPAKGMYCYTVNTDYDIGSGGLSMLWLEGNGNEFSALYLPTGQKAGDTISNWLQCLHMARVGGLAYKIFLCLMGFVVAMLSVTGVYIWWKKRHALKLKLKMTA